MPKTKLTPNEIINNSEIFSRAFLKILTRGNELIPFRWNKAQKHFHAHRTGRDIILKARQLGFTTYIQGEIYRRSVTGTRSTITLAHDSETTAKIRLIADRFWENCKIGNAQPQRKYANASMTTYPEFDSVVTIATAGNVNTGRGGTYSDFHGSEAAYWPDAQKIITGALQGGTPDAILESTANGAQGYFYDLCMDAMRGKSVWKLHFYPWWWNDDYRLELLDGEQINYTDEEQELVDKHDLTVEQIKWRRVKILELRDKFKQEYPEDPISCFLTSGNSYFGDILDFFTAPMEAEYNSKHEYFAGLDFGQTNDFTAMPVIDRTTKKQVDLLHINKLEWKEQRRRIISMYKKWHCQQLVAEWNSIGGPNIEELQHYGVNLVPFKTTNQSKSEIMAGLYEGLHTDGLRLQDWPVQRHEMNTFVSSQTSTGIWKLAAEGIGHDDTVIALALAWLACRVGITDNEITRMEKDEIDWSDIPDEMIQAAVDSGVEVPEEILQRLKQKEKA